jgi:hypothetical protein
MSKGKTPPMPNKTYLFAITASGFEFPDYVRAETEEEAILQWAAYIAEVQITKIEEE